MFIDWLKAIVEGSMGGLGLLLFIGILVVGTMLVSVNKSKKVFYGFLILALGFFIYAKCTCGPNFFDVRIMHPMAEKISDYIMKNGIPKSLKDIPDLPYKLEGCKKDKEFDYQENCKFKNKMINLYFRHGKNTIDNKIYEDANLEMRHVINNTTETGLLMEFEKKEAIFRLKGKIKIYSGKTDGICNPMRQ